MGRHGQVKQYMELEQKMDLAGQCEYEDCREGRRVRSGAPSQGLMFACYTTIARTLAF